MRLSQKRSRRACIGAAVLLMWVCGGPAAAQTFVLSPDTDVVGSLKIVETAWEDTLLDIARRHGVGYEEIRRANPGIDPWLPGAGTRVVVPTQYVLPAGPRIGIVLNLPEKRLYYYPPAAPGERPVVKTYPVSIGRMDWSTPLGATKIVAKEKNPAWHPPASVRAEYRMRGEELPPRVPPGPDNPLGDYALRLALPGYLIHGTNRPYGIGMRVTHGCVRLYPEDIEALYEAVPIGTSVRIVNQPHKAGWRDGRLYLESHPPLDEHREQLGNNLTPAVRAILAVRGDRPAAIDWNRLAEIAEQARGVPEPVSR